MVPHPLDPLSPSEISAVAKHVRSAFPGRNPYFRVITLSEPSKSELVPFLDIQNARLQSTHSNERPPRTAMVQVYLDNRSSHNFYELIIDLNSEDIIRTEQLKGRHSHVDTNDMEKCEAACMADSRVQEAIQMMELPEEAVICVESWTYATDGMNDMSKKITMCYFYMRLEDHLDANYYAYPLDICAEMSGDLEILKVYHIPSDEQGQVPEKSKPFDRRKIHNSSEYHPDIVNQSYRTSTKAYYISQPDGPSFETEGNHISWEKWTFRVGFNYREGMTLHNIRYDGRSLFYRLSLSEMFVPYGDPRTPYTRKAAFDLGNDGAGVNANNLKLGCDCLGHIKYFDGWHTTSNGDPIKLPNVICCHEIDDGILWKHTNYRTQNPVLARSRVLVLQTIVTVSNYEYIFAFHFGQDASIHYEVRATGILSTAPIGVDDQGVSFGTIVAPGVMAAHHQHLFCLRIDPALDGHKNSLQIEESHPMPLNDPKTHNPHAVGYHTISTIVENEGGLDLDARVNRVFKIINENIMNPISQTPIGFKLVPHPSQMLLADRSSYHARRSEFPLHAIWVTTHHDNELFAAGTHTMQSLGDEGIASWIKSREASSGNTNGYANGEQSTSSVRNKDIVLWHTFGSTHNPRVEDWPVMPCEKMTVGLKPVNFFTRSPAMDVDVAKAEMGRSVLVHDTRSGNGEVNGHV